MAGTKKPSGVRGVSWRERETLDLLAFWGDEKVQEALRETHRNIDVFEKIAEQMVARGHNRSAVECRTKTKALRQEYKRVVAHNNQSGNSPVTCPFYDELHRILRPISSMRPKRLTRGLNLQVVEVVEEEPRPSVEGMGGSQDLFSHNVLTIKSEDMWCSTPVDAYTDEAVPNTAENYPVLGEDLDEPRVTDNMQQGDVAASGAQAALPEGHMVQPSTPTPEEQGEPSDAHWERPVAELSPATRLTTTKNRKRRVALLNDVAQQMLRQCAMEESNANRRHEEMMAEDRRRHIQMVEETRLDRRAFQDAMQRNMDVILTAVSALKTIGEVMLARRQGALVQDREQSSGSLNSYPCQASHPVRLGNSTEAQGNVPGVTPNKRVCTGLTRAPTDL